MCVKREGSRIARGKRATGSHRKLLADNLYGQPLFYKYESINRLAEFSISLSLLLKLGFVKFFLKN
ncbi:hypothetical protein GCM10007968_10450 [Sporolactobacillus putidus]|uniref:Uncharacterized protein n=1 Tax=Sporolactobacillus putidus TaxID=492735 RepID=A0A917S036_9BACL|nr:hypothetical protein GCM10007968_10450 [Sporolactobacillus putidus]